MPPRNLLLLKKTETLPHNKEHTHPYTHIQAGNFPSHQTAETELQAPIRTGAMCSCSVTSRQHNNLEKQTTNTKTDERRHAAPATRSPSVTWKTRKILRSAASGSGTAAASGHKQEEKKSNKLAFLSLWVQKHAFVQL